MCIWHWYSIAQVLYNHLHTYVCIYVVLAIACMEAYGFLRMVTLGYTLVILVVQILHIKLDTYNTAYASCETWTLYIFFLL